MKLVVNDANVLIDLVKLKLLPHFFALKINFYTTDLVLTELYDDQKEALLPYIDNKILEIISLTEDQLIEIYMINLEKNQLSDTDCSAFYLAKKLNGTLLTSDLNLRNFSKEKEIEVHGHLWVFDLMIKEQTITNTRAIEKLKELTQEINPKLGLPKHECDKRYKSWSNL